MRVFLTVTFALLLSNLNAQNLQSKDSIQIVSIIEDWNKAWKIKDYLLASKGYNIDAKFTNAFGDSKNGKIEIEQLLQEVFSLQFVMSGVSSTVKQTFQVLTDQVIVVHTYEERAGQKLPDNTLLPTRRTTHLRVFQNINSEWKITSHLISDAKDKVVLNK